jgi:uncharacterized protein with HEPN domain
MAHYKDLNEGEKTLTLDVLSLKTLLSDCIISDSYIANPDMLQAVVYTDAGMREIAEISRRQPRLKPQTTRLMTLLRFEHDGQFMVEITKTDIEKLRKTISDEIKNKKLYFPWIYGRDFADLLVNQGALKPNLNSKETIAALKLIPTGVFQVGHFTVGPFGCLKSPEFRMMEPKREVSGFLEVRGTDKRHRYVKLSTGVKSEIFKAQETDGRIREREETNSHHTSYNTVQLAEDMVVRDVKLTHFPDTVFLLLGETLSLREVKSIATRVIPEVFRRDNGNKRLETAIGMIIGEVDSFVEQLNRQQLQQIFHLATNKELYLSIEAAIEAGEVNFLEGLSRYAKDSSGASTSQLEITPKGIRKTNSQPHGLFATNVMDLLYQLFVKSGLKSRADLQFIMDSEENDLDTLIQKLVSEWPPNRIIDYLCGQKDLAVFAGEHLGIRNAEVLSSQAIRAKIIYKLAVPGEPVNSILDDLESQLSQLEITDKSDVRTVDSLAHQLFNLFETVFTDVIVFTWWALVEPKDKNKASFAYNHEREKNSLRYEELFASTKDAKAPTLQPLASAFTKLRVKLMNLETTPFQNGVFGALSDAEDRPVVFRASEMFHNLNQGSKDKVLGAVESIAKVLGDQDVGSLRNSVDHGNRTRNFSELEILNAITKIRVATKALRSTGLFPELWLFKHRSIDEIGFTNTTYTRAGNLIEIQEPTRAYAPGLPNYGKQLYFLPGCKLEHLGPLRFSLDQIRPDEEYWKNFPPEIIIEIQPGSMGQISVTNGDEDAA